MRLVSNNPIGDGESSLGRQRGPRCWRITWAQKGREKMGKGKERRVTKGREQDMGGDKGTGGRDFGRGSEFRGRGSGRGLSNLRKNECVYGS